MQSDTPPQAPHLLVEAGPDQGLAIHVGPSGARLGRASQNDVTLADPLLSRHHCQLEFRGDRLWVVDLASANQTIVNGQPVTESSLRRDDHVLIGDTLLRVVLDRPQPEAEPGVPPPPSGDALAATAAVPPTTGPEAPIVDLGFESRREKGEHRPSLRPVLWTIGAVALLLIGASLILKDSSDGGPQIEQLPPPPSFRPLEIHYEKVDGTAESIFRYEMTLTPPNRLAIRIDDLAQNRHVRREKEVDTNLVSTLARELESSGVFSLEEAYEGIPLERVWTTYDLVIALDQRVARTRVANRVEPDTFRTVREILETFGKNELGIWAIQFPAEQLISLAQDALQRGQNLFDGRDVAYGNLAEAIRNFKEAEFYLETVEPKPPFHADIISGGRQATEELDARYEQQRFRADRSLNLQNWAAAAAELRILRELVPDTNDPRNREATRKLLDVENRLKSRRNP